jgi:glycosyltransferase involved in cell wall biosynthesis
MNEDTDILISVITPTLNSGRFIEQNLRSVQGQDFRQTEHIIVDGGSTDDTIGIVRSVGRDCRVLPGPDRGISDAMNKGIRTARGKIIGILHSDDYYDHGVLSDVASAYVGSGFDFILHGDLRAFDDTKSLHLKPYPVPRLYFYFDLPFFHPTVFVPKKIYEDTGLYDPSYTLAMDFDFLLRAMLEGYTFRYLPRIVAHFRQGGAANKNPLQCHREVLRSQLSRGLNPFVCRISYLSKVGVNRLKGLVRSGSSKI